ncbi:MAG: DUF423 domain-containing protein [Methylococcales bacterium]|nr:DUF423 domain-containing protein [Methylococcales bacterium]
MPTSIFLFLSAVCGLTGVMMGAFGAHGLKAILSPEMLAVYKTGVDYQMWHALGLGVIALLHQQASDSPQLEWAGWLMFAGICLFSGSLYLLAILNMKWLGMITPLGGIAFLAAWTLVAIFAYPAQKQD